MRFMMFMIPAVYQPDTPPDKSASEGFAPIAEAVAAMTKYNEELAKAGVLVSLDGLHPLLDGARVSFHGGKPVVIDGPSVKAKEVVGGYWTIDVKSKEEAIEWAKRCPASDDDVIELRQIQELSEFPEDVRAAAKSPTVQAEIERHIHQ